MSPQPSTTIVIPTRGRPGYLGATLATVAPQARAAASQLLVIADGPDPQAELIARRHGARFHALPRPRGANAARNTAISLSDSELLVFIDDDVEVPAGWLPALLAAAAGHPEVDVFGGPIRACLENPPRACGREPAPITTLDLGPRDREVSLVWSANMAIRRRALQQVGPFDETIFIRGDEEDWQRRYLAAGGRVRYVAAAGLYHRRTAEDSTLRRLSRAAYGHGRAARRYDARKGAPPPLRGELRTLAGCAWHTVRRRCAFGIVMGAHTAGRLREALAGPTP